MDKSKLSRSSDEEAFVCWTQYAICWKPQLTLKKKVDNKTEHCSDRAHSVVCLLARSRCMFCFDEGMSYMCDQSLHNPYGGFGRRLSLFECILVPMAFSTQIRHVQMSKIFRYIDLSPMRCKSWFENDHILICSGGIPRSENT